MFKFRLKRVLDYYSKDEIAKKLDLAQSLRQAESTRGKIRQAEREIRNLAPREDRDVAWLQYAAERSDFQILEIQRYEVQLAGEQRITDEKRQLLAATSARRRGLELLRDKRQAEYRVQANRKEQIRQDDIYQILKVRKE